MLGTHLVLLALQKPGQKNLFSLVRPNTGNLCTVCLACNVKVLLDVVASVGVQVV
jgi:hypothetical protein